VLLLQVPRARNGSGGACMAKGIRVQCFHREAIRSAYTKMGCWPITSSILNTKEYSTATVIRHSPN